MQKPKRACPLKMQAHIKNLGLSSVKDYKKWCRSHNFSQGLNKNKRQRKNELDFFNRINATEILRRKKREGSLLKNVIRFVCALEIRLRECDYMREPSLEAVCTDIASAMNVVKLDFETCQAVEAMMDVFCDTCDPKLLQDCLLHMEHCSNLLKLRKNFGGIDGFNATIHEIRAIVDDHETWVRPLKHWRPKKSDFPARQFSHLIRHLYALYPVPKFLDAAWNRGSIQKDWWKHIAARQNIRTAERLPILLTKRMANYVMAAPSHYSIEKAIVWAQIRSIAGVQHLHLVEPLCTKFCVKDEAYMWDIFVNDNDFWLNVMRFFSNTDPKLSPSLIEIMIDYIIYQKYGGGGQTGFRMKGRRTENLLRQATQWQQQQDQWERSGIGGLYREDASGARRVKYWCVRELLSPSALITESKILSHCVGNTNYYMNRCYEGRSAIFTMELKEDAQFHKLLTIEVSLDDSPQIVQVAGLKNRRATEEERFWIAVWADQEGLLY